MKDIAAKETKVGLKDIVAKDIKAELEEMRTRMDAFGYNLDKLKEDVRRIETDIVTSVP